MFSFSKIRTAMAVGLLAVCSHGLEGYYKDLFMDGGAGVTSKTKLPAADSAGLAYERVSTSSKDLTLQVMSYTLVDTNGHLLYPDKSPRFRMIYVNGGHAVDHGDSLGPVGRQRIIDFYNNGGSYSGTCAGAIFATQSTGTYERAEYNPSYLHIYPGRSHYTQLADSYTDMLIPSGSPLLKYDNYGGDGRVSQIYHNGGNYVIKDDDYYWAPGTEILATFAGPVVGDDKEYLGFLGQGSIWAYKTNVNSGRMVLLGSHPEGNSSGERLHLFAGCLKYALEGLGAPRVKGALTSGITRTMSNNNKAGFEKIGDKQYHHFTISVPSNTASLTINLDGQAGYDFGLYAHQGSFAFDSKSNFKSKVAGGKQQVVIKHPNSGTWYIGVELISTVTYVTQTWGQDYTGNLPVLNGLSYTVKAVVKAGTSLAKVGADPEELNLVPMAQGNMHQLDLKVPVAGEYEFVLRSLTGQVMARKIQALPEGKSHISIDLDGMRGTPVVGTLKGPQGMITGRWTL